MMVSKATEPLIRTYRDMVCLWEWAGVPAGNQEESRAGQARGKQRRGRQGVRDQG